MTHLSFGELTCDMFCFGTLTKKGLSQCLDVSDPLLASIL